MHLQAVAAEITIKKTTLVSHHPLLRFLPNGKGELSTWKVHKSRPTRPKPDKTDDYHRSGGRATQTKEQDTGALNAISLQCDAMGKTKEIN